RCVFKSAVPSRCCESSMPRESSRFTYSMNSLTSPCIRSILRRMLRIISTPARLTPRSRVSDRIVSSCSRSSSESRRGLPVVGGGIAHSFALGARGLEQSFALVQPQRLRVDVVLLRHRADHVVRLAGRFLHRPLPFTT